MFFERHLSTATPRLPIKTYRTNRERTFKIQVYMQAERSNDSNSVEVEVEVNLRPTVGRLVRHPSGTRDQFFFLLEIYFRQLRLCYFVAPSLMRGGVCNLLYKFFGPCQSSHSWVEVPLNSRPYFTLSSETAPTWKARSSYLYPPGTG
jgi:hypothetical protein